MPWLRGQSRTSVTGGANATGESTSTGSTAAVPDLAAKAGLEVGTHIWVPSAEDAWQPGVVAGIADGSVLVDLTKGRQKVPLGPSTPQGSSPWLPRNPELLSAEGALTVEDLSSLTLLHEAELLHALEVRFQHDLVYTYTGPVLLAVNPFRNLPDLYSYERLRYFVDLAPGGPAPPPHVFSAARDAYQGVWRAGTSQTVLVSGESGAGKTETTKFVMRFLALAGAGGTEDSMSVVERRVLQAIPLLEALGNAKTLRNDNSSRFGKYTELHFGRVAPEETQPAEGERHRQLGPRLSGAKTNCYLLEKVRVVGPQAGERSFHVFYQLLAAAKRLSSGGASPNGACAVRCPPSLTELLKEVGPARPQGFAYLATSCNEELAGHNEAEDFDATLAAMQAFDMPDEDVASIFSAVLAVLHLGNVAFRAPANNSEGSEVVNGARPDGPLAVSSKLLGVDPQALEATMCKRAMKVKDEGTITQIRSVPQAKHGRDALARHLYGAIFAFAISCINSHLGLEAESPTQISGKVEDRSSFKDRCRGAPFVGVLDIFGFEFFEHNSFEQLCINFTNELLQQYFNAVIFEHEGALYAREGVHWDPQDFPDNKAVVELLGGDGQAALSGVLPLLDEECNVTGGTAETWCRKLTARYPASELFQPVKQRQTHFVIRHFAGPVEYEAEEFLAKNKDTLSLDALECLKASSNPFIQQRFLEHGRTFGTQTAVTSGRKSVMRAKSYSVSSEFRQQLKVLMDGIRSTSPHFVRCIKPNSQSVPSVFNRRSIAEQLRYQGVLEAIRVSRAGYPVRRRHREAVLQYRPLAPRALQRKIELEFGRDAFAAAATLLCGALGQTFLEGSLQGLQLGATQLFLRRETAEVLASALRNVRESAAVRLEAFQRRRRCMRRYAIVRHAVVTLQAAARAAAARRELQRRKRLRATSVLQRFERGRRARAACKRKLAALRVLQGVARARSQRLRFQRICSVCVQLQRWHRRVVRAKHHRRRTVSAVALQRSWRGMQGRALALRVRKQRAKLLALCVVLVQRWRKRALTRVRTSLGAHEWKTWPPAPGSPRQEEIVRKQAPTLAHMAGANASLERSNKLLLAEVSALETRCTSLQLDLRKSEEAGLGWSSLLQCCYSRNTARVSSRK